MALVKVTRNSGIPLIGHIAFGMVCRGSSNLIQVRPTTICNISCPFCSTDGGPFSTSHITHYVVDHLYLKEEIQKLARIKGALHINIDSVGEPTTHPHLTTLISDVAGLPEVMCVTMQTNGTLLNEQKIKEMECAGLKRINLSIHALSDNLARKLAGAGIYDIRHIKEVARMINKSKIELLLAPVFLPGINDGEIRGIICFGKELNCKVAIQKYEEYRYSRKMKGVKKQNFYKFYAQLREWEKEFGMRLIYNASSLDVGRAPALKPVFRIGERCNVTVLAEGWMKDQKIASARNRCVTINNCKASPDDKVNIRITDTKNNIYLAEVI